MGLFLGFSFLVPGGNGGGGRGWVAEAVLSPGILGGWREKGGQRGKGEGCLALSCWPPCLPYGCGYLRRISILKPPFVLGTEKGIVRPEKDLDKIRTVPIQDSV